MKTVNDILEGYAAAAAGTPSLITRFEAIDPAELYAPVLDLFPTVPGRAADIGAGTGRDAAWLAGLGHDVLAVEPVRELREAGMALHPERSITWLDDLLPDLAKTRSHAPFDLILLSGVWQHIDDDARRIAMPHLGAMMSTGGLLVMSLRHGPGAPGRRVFEVSPDKTVETAARAGLSLIHRSMADSVQPGNRAMGVRWTWLAFRKRPSG